MDATLRPFGLAKLFNAPALRVTETTSRAHGVVKQIGEEGVGLMVKNYHEIDASVLSCRKKHSFACDFFENPARAE